jgi:hypothetical protein
MKSFLDTAHLDEIQQASDFGLLDGITTNPTLLAHAFYCGILWTASVGDSFHSLLQHRVASPARVPGLPEGRQSARAVKSNASSN